jgi:hypothetical protein
MNNGGICVKKVFMIIVAVTMLLAAATAVPHVTYACQAVFPGEAMC